MSEQEALPEGLDLTNFRDCCLHDLAEMEAAGGTGVAERRAFFEAAFSLVPDLTKSWPAGNNNLAYVGMQLIRLLQLFDLYQDQFSPAATKPPSGARVH